MDTWLKSLKQMKKWLAIIVVVSLTAMLYYYKHRQQSSNIPQLVHVTRGDISQTATAVGNIVPAHSITVKSHLSGIVEAIFRDEGEAVKQNDKLLQIKPDPTPQDYAQAIALVAQDQASVTNFTQQVNNYRLLLNQHIIKENFADYLTAQQNLTNAQAKLLYDQQSLDLLTSGNTTIDGAAVESVIISPIDGFILQRAVDVGDPIISLASAQSATVLFTIANMNDLIFKGSVDEMDAAKLQTGMSAMLTVAAMSDNPVAGTLTQLSLQSDNQNSTTDASATSSSSPFNVGFQVEIGALTIPQGMLLRSGYSATAEIVIREAKNVLLLPERVIIFKDDKTFVKIPAQQGQTTTLKEITVGLSDGMNVEIKEGLREQEAVLDQHDEKNS